MSTTHLSHAEQLTSFQESGFGASGSRAQDIDRRRALEGVVSVEAHGENARVPSMYGDLLSIGSIVNHATLQWATARVIGFQVDDSGRFRYPWVKVLVEHIDLLGNPTGKVDSLNNRWDWDRTHLGHIIL